MMCPESYTQTLIMIVALCTGGLGIRLWPNTVECFMVDHTATELRTHQCSIANTHPVVQVKLQIHPSAMKLRAEFLTVYGIVLKIPKYMAVCHIPLYDLLSCLLVLQCSEYTVTITPHKECHTTLCFTFCRFSTGEWFYCCPFNAKWIWKVCK